MLFWFLQISPSHSLETKTNDGLTFEDLNASKTMFELKNKFAREKLIKNIVSKLFF
jgi:hypothetical protein